jgi:Glycosyltransferase family 10 (fucosyltransferase) C-term
MKRKLIIVDSSHPLMRENRCFDPKEEFSGCGHALNVRLARESQKRGIEIMTADVWMKTDNSLRQSGCITEMATPLTGKLIALGAKPLICQSTESPFNAQPFYHSIARYAGRFYHNYHFRGAQERLLSTKTNFHSLVFPVETRIPLPLKPWGQRKHLVMVNSNKRAIVRRIGNLQELAKAAAKQLRYRFWRLSDPWLRLREGYVIRIEAIRYFSRHSGFELYGMGWDAPVLGYGADYQEAVKRVYAGVIPAGVLHKREAISGFKFALCFENCPFPGYVTEKITDCFLAGCIPVYWGPPDIGDFVPPETYIDFRRFNSFSALDTYLAQLTEREALQYIEAARDFMRSKAFDQFDVDALVTQWLNIVES